VDCHGFLVHLYGLRGWHWRLDRFFHDQGAQWVAFRRRYDGDRLLVRSYGWSSGSWVCNSENRREAGRSGKFGYVGTRCCDIVSNLPQIYIPIIVALALVFWLVPQFYVSAIAVGLQGFFIGPLFPCAIIVATKILPKHLHVSAIGFAAAAGGGGAAMFPFAIGAIAQKKGVEVLQPVVLALLVADFLLWLSLPRVEKQKQ
jgi:MFS family permease